MNTELHAEIIKLIVAYTLVGAFVFTVVVTCLSMVGFIKLADKAQQNKLFGILVVELATGCVTFFLGFLQIDPKAVQRDIEKPLQLKAQTLAKEKQAVQQVADATAKRLAASEVQLFAAKVQSEESAAKVAATSASLKLLQAEHERQRAELQQLKTQSK